MKSPFPGMDPYLERHWEDVHTALIGYVRDALQPQLADDLIARMEEKVYVEDDTVRHLRRPDVRVVEHPPGWATAPWPDAGAATAVIDEVLLLEPVGEPIRQRNVLIYDVAGRRVVTAIEILSPWNKAPGKPVETYLDKRTQYVNSEINLIEIDLIRAGDWIDMVGPFIVPPRARTTYRVTVSQPEARGPYLYPMPLRSKLTTIKVPLRPHDTPARLDLQSLVEKAYEMGRYDRIDYAQPPVPPFDEADQAWADEVLRAAGKSKPTARPPK